MSKQLILVLHKQLFLAHIKQCLYRLAGFKLMLSSTCIFFKLFQVH